jgi:plastocyanin
MTTNGLVVGKSGSRFLTLRSAGFGMTSIFGAMLVVVMMVSLAHAGEVKGKVSAAGLKSAGNIVVYVDVIAGKKFEAPADHVLVDQKNLVYVPHVTAILKGTTVDFSNSDHVAHNVYWPSINGNKMLKHSLTVVSPGQKKSWTFDNLGAAQLLCEMHPDMSAYVVVVPTPYFALTGNDGTFSIKNVPAGSYTLKTWSEDGKPTTQAITATDAATNVDLTVGK